MLVGGSEEAHSEDDADAPLEERKMRRKHRNRLSAAASRQRKKEWVETLQEHLRALTAENEKLRQQLIAPSAQAGAAAGLLAFGGGAPAAANAISADRALGRCLRAHGISEAIHVQVHAEHLGRAAALAGTAEAERTDWMPTMSSSSSASVIDTPGPTPPQAGAPTPMTMPPALVQLLPKAQAYALPPNLPPTARGSASCGEGPAPARARKLPPHLLSRHASTPGRLSALAATTRSGNHPCNFDETSTETNPSMCAKRAREVAPASSDRSDPNGQHPDLEPPDSEPPDLEQHDSEPHDSEATDGSAADATAGAAPIQLDLVRALRSLRASANAEVIADRAPDHLMRVASVQ
jgi:hypothetical protein